MINHPPPWLKNGATIQEGELTSSWMSRAGLDFEVEKRDVYFHPNLNPTDITAIPNTSALVRTDTMTPLSIVSQNRYKIVQPIDIISLYRDISKTHALKLEAGGALKEGKTVWALASTGNTFKVKNDNLTEYILFSTGFDGKATRGCLVTRRDSCWNTLEIAMRRGQSKISITHAQYFNHANVKMEMGFNNQDSSEYLAQLNRLAETRIRDIKAREFFTSVYFPGVEKNNLTNRQHNRLDALMLIYCGGLGSNQGGIHGSLWGVVNAVTFDVDHVSTSKSNDNRMVSAWFGKGRTVKNAAYDLAVALTEHPDILHPLH